MLYLLLVKKCFLMSLVNQQKDVAGGRGRSTITLVTNISVTLLTVKTKKNVILIHLWLIMSLADRVKQNKQC